MTTTKRAGKRANRIGIDCSHYEEPETARAIVRERVKLAMVQRLREAGGKPMRPTGLADTIGTSGIMVSRIAHEAPRTFVVVRSTHKGASRRGMANIEITLHPHLARGDQP